VRWRDACVVLLTTTGIPSVVIRCPCTYPPDTLKVRMLSGMGVPA
jgi:predicted AlkP superfamily phosphohydrolase/phosphomutase